MSTAHPHPFAVERCLECGCKLTVEPDSWRCSCGRSGVYVELAGIKARVVLTDAAPAKTDGDA